MNLFSFIILGLMATWIIASLRYIYKNKDEGCSGSCEGCPRKCMSRSHKNKQ